MRSQPQIRLAVSTLLWLLLCAGGAFVPTVSPRTALLYALLLGLGFWLPAQRLNSPAGLRRRWRALLAWSLAATFLWDLATVQGLGRRALFSEWPLVYTSGAVVLLLLLLVHAATVQWLTRRLRVPTAPAAT